MANARRGPIRAGDLTPELAPALELIRDGEAVILRGYVNGRRCPARVKAGVIAAVRDYDVRDEDGTPHPGRSLEQAREVLLAVIPGLEDGEADVLANDDSEAGGLAVLRLLGWFDDGAEAGDDDAGEATAGGSTTVNYSPISRPLTAPTTG